MTSVSVSSTALIVAYEITRQPGSNPARQEVRLGTLEPRRLDHDVRAAQALFPAVCREYGLGEALLEPGGEVLTALAATGVDADLLEVEQPVEQAHVPVGGPA